MNSPDLSPETPPQNANEAGAMSPEPDPSMQEYYKLQQELFRLIVLFTAVAFVAVWVVYSANTALNYLIGACTGVVYLRMLARNVEQLGRERNSLSKTRLALLVGLILVASRWDQLQILPIFLGFLTYKAAVLFYMLRTAILPDSN
ncbi:ATP synthase subunit I [Leptolyngbya sp. AN02str]|uniref:ATP synthase subunit I n=1 Tax=Leptolyngbya sp. AN02str TaxID=3423363 RepID=UPI003D3219EF